MTQKSLWKLGGLTWRQLVRRVWAEMKEDQIPGQAAQLSYYLLLALFPLILVLTAVIGLFLDSGTFTRAAIDDYFKQVAPGDIGVLIQKTLDEVNSGASGGKISIGLVGTFWAASSGMIALIGALNVAYDLTEARSWWKQRLVAILLTIAVVVLLILALVLMTFGGEFAEVLAHNVGFGSLFVIAWKVMQWPVLLVCVLMAFNLIYLYAPNIKHHEWHWLMPGTAVGVIVWLMASFGFKVYLMFFNKYSLTYGSIAGVIILLLWLYFTGIAILLGAEVNSEIASACGTPAQMKT
jgi:membrane protein